MSSQPDVKPRRDIEPTQCPWHDASRPPHDRVSALVAAMTLEEGVSHLCGLWVGMDAAPGEMAPNQHEMLPEVMDWDDAIRDGIGQLTRPFGTAPVEPAVGVRTLAAAQRQVAGALSNDGTLPLPLNLRLAVVGRRRPRGRPRPLPGTRRHGGEGLAA